MDETSKLSIYDKHKIYDKDIKPLIVEAMRICVVNDIPFFFASATINNEKKTHYEYECALTGSLGINLKDDHFEQYLCVTRGFKAVPPTQVDPFFEGEIFALEDYKAINQDFVDSIKEDPPEQTK